MAIISSSHSHGNGDALPALGTSTLRPLLRTVGPEPMVAQPLDMLLARLADRLARQIRACLAQSRLSLEQWRVLDVLSDGTSHSMSQITEQVMVPAPTLTRIVDQLVGLGLVARRVDDTDRRRVLVHVTKAGADLHTRVAPVVRQVRHRSLARLRANDVRRLMLLLIQLDTPSWPGTAEHRRLTGSATRSHPAAATADSPGTPP